MNRAPLYNRITGTRVVLYHIFVHFSRGFRKIGFFVTEFYFHRAKHFSLWYGSFVFCIKVFYMKFSERNKGRVTFVAGTTKSLKIGFRSTEDDIGRRTVLSSERARRKATQEERRLQTSLLQAARVSGGLTAAVSCVAKQRSERRLFPFGVLRAILHKLYTNAMLHLILL